MEQPLGIRILPPAKKYIDGLSPIESGFIGADIRNLIKGEFASVSTKQLRGKIREMRTGDHRITYFVKEHSLYFVRGFRKTTNKTPKSEIDYAEKVLKMTK